MCLLPYSSPSVCSSPISLYISVISLFSSSTFSFLGLFILRHDQISLIFFKTKECTWSHSSVYFLISFLFISKPTEQTVDNVCGIPLPNLSLVLCNPTSHPCIYLVKTGLAKISDDRLSWKLHNQDIIFLLFYLLASYKTDEHTLGLFSILYACMTGTFLLEHGSPGFDFY